MEPFSSSDEAFAAEALFQAYRSGDAAQVRQCVASTRTFLELDNQVRCGMNRSLPSLSPCSQQV